MPARRHFIAILSLLGACGTSSDGTTETDGGGTGSITMPASSEVAETGSSETSTGSNETTDTSENTLGSGTDAEASSGTGQPPIDPGPARGIAGFEVQLNQGLRITDKDPPLPGRETLVRFYVDVDETIWDATSPGGRMLEASFFLRTADGIEQPAEIREVWLAGDSDDAVPGSTVDFALEAQWVEPGVGYRLELREVDPELAMLPLPVVDPVYPETDWAEIPVSETAPTLNVTVVPYDYQGGCTPETTIDAAFVDAIGREIKNFFPASELNLELHDPVPWTSSLATADSLDNLLADVASVRADDGPAPDVYYVGIIDTCTECEDCPPGTGFIPGTSVAEAQFRAAMVRVRGTTDEERISRTSNTAAHELGHNHNRDHIVCAEQSSQPGTVDNAYPDEDGYIQTFGYRFSTSTLYGPEEAYDLMSYCSSARWISDYTRDAIAEHMAAVTASAKSRAPGPEREYVFALVDDAGEIVRSFVAIAAAGDGVPVQEVGIGESTSVLLRLDPTRLPVSRGSLRVHHRGRDLTVPLGTVAD